MFFIFFTQFIWIDWFAVFYYDFGRFHFREMGFEDVCRIVDSDRDDRAFSLGCDLEASLMEWKHVQFVFVSVSGSLREDADGEKIGDSIPFIKPALIICGDSLNRKSSEFQRLVEIAKEKNIVVL